MNYWLHRISHHAEVSHPLLSKNLLTIGFSDFAYPSFIEDVLTGGWQAIETAFDNEWGVRPRARYSLCRFIYDMKKDDLVIVPSWGSFSVYRIVEDKPKTIGATLLPAIADWHGKRFTLNGDVLVTDDGMTIDLGFTRKVEPVATDISRADFADAALTARLKVRTTNTNISDLKASIDKALDAHAQKRPINLRSQILEAAVPMILERLKSELNPAKFENLVAWYFQRVGASDTSIPARNEPGKEGDADVVAIFEGIKTIVYTQVKFHRDQTDTWATEQIMAYKDNKEMMDDGYSKVAWVVSSADGFSDDCYVLAKENKVQLIDGPKFAQMLLEVGLTNLDKAL